MNLYEFEKQQSMGDYGQCQVYQSGANVHPKLVMCKIDCSDNPATLTVSHCVFTRL